MPIFKAFLPGVACFALGACDGGFDLGVSRAAPERIQLSDGLIIAGSEGWCVDQASSRAGADRAVVVLGSCAAIAGNDRAAAPDVDGVVTVSVDAAEVAPPPLEALESFFATEAGRAALARDGQAESIEIVEMSQSDGMLLVHAADRSASSGIAADFWRALFDLDGRLVSVTLFGVEDDPISPDLGRSTLSAQVASLRDVNANTNL